MSNAKGRQGRLPEAQRATLTGLGVEWAWNGRDTATSRCLKWSDVPDHTKIFIIF
ncbi:hypothetical protein AB0C81_12270 [Streptomyces roseoverticillatus]|uniref:hypothetical protein n=1 Tax=Streptomyces roseoverticillatus TaxID=66429 RepID=UPI0033CA88A5